MFCPRCGAQANETIKFCRGCGLPLLPIAAFVASGGTAPLVSESSAGNRPQNQFLESWGGLTSKQQLILSILFFVFLPGIFGVMGNFPGPFHIFRGLSGMAGVLVPLGVIWSIFRHKARMGKWRAQQAMNYQQMYAPPASQATQPMASTPSLAPSSTIPLREAPQEKGSVIEEETQRLPQAPRQSH